MPWENIAPCRAFREATLTIAFGETRIYVRERADQAVGILGA